MRKGKRQRKVDGEMGERGPQPPQEGKKLREAHSARAGAGFRVKAL